MVPCTYQSVEETEKVNDRVLHLLHPFLGAREALLGLAHLRMRGGAALDERLEALDLGLDLFARRLEALVREMELGGGGGGAG